MEQMILFIAALVAAGLAAAFFGILRTLLLPQRNACPNPEWIERFSTARYRPMERLLAERDFVFLAAQRGYEPAMARRLRAERRELFRGYLRSLQRDFGRICAALEVCLVHGAQDRPELAAALLRQRILFQWRVLQLQVRLALHAWGLGAVDARALLGVLESMRLELRQLAPAAAAA